MIVKLITAYLSLQWNTVGYYALFVFDSVSSLWLLQIICTTILWHHDHNRIPSTFGSCTKPSYIKWPLLIKAFSKPRLRPPALGCLMLEHCAKCTQLQNWWRSLSRSRSQQAEVWKRPQICSCACRSRVSLNFGEGKCVLLLLPSFFQAMYSRFQNVTK